MKQATTGYGIVGAGRAGLSVAVALAEAGIASRVVIRRPRRREQVAAWLADQRLDAVVACVDAVAALCSDVTAVLVAVPDREIEAVADELAAAGVTVPWLHLSAAMPVDALRRAGGPAVGGLHPLAALVDPVHAGRAAAVHAIRGCLLTVDGDPAALASVAPLLAILAGPVQRIAAERRALYHAAAALAANDWVALLDAAERAALRAGVTPQAARAGLLHLAASALAAVATLPIGAPLGLGLTGAVARGDADTIAGHLAALAPTPADAALHGELCLRLVQLAVAAGRIDDRAAGAVEVAIRRHHRLDPTRAGDDSAGWP
ncbi:MAG: DUF2520 domain-containing protein [Myxococcales bacterium]|nr:DUF2520 domain-containing protein [Myxococcales bacterium]